MQIYKGDNKNQYVHIFKLVDGSEIVLKDTEIERKTDSYIRFKIGYMETLEIYLDKVTTYEHISKFSYERKLKEEQDALGIRIDSDEE